MLMSRHKNHRQSTQQGLQISSENAPSMDNFNQHQQTEIKINNDARIFSGVHFSSKKWQPFFFLFFSHRPQNTS